MSNKTILQNHNDIISTNNISIDDLIERINNLPEAGGEVVEPILQEKTITPTTSSQTVKPDTGYDGLSQVTINAVTSSIDSDIKASNIKKGVNILGVTGTLESGITPSGTMSITSNGTYDVTNYASANVNVPTSGGGSNIETCDVTINIRKEAIDYLCYTGIDENGVLCLKEIPYIDTTSVTFTCVKNTPITVADNSLTTYPTVDGDNCQYTGLMDNFANVIVVSADTVLTAM